MYICITCYFLKYICICLYICVCTSLNGIHICIFYDTYTYACMHCKYVMMSFNKHHLIRKLIDIPGEERKKFNRKMDIYFDDKELLGQLQPMQSVTCSKTKKSENDKIKSQRR